MSTKYRMALGVSPLLLRLALAVTFIWAGLGKIMATAGVEGETAAILANMGVVKPLTGGVGTETTPTTPLPPSSDRDEGEKPARTPGANGTVDAGTVDGGVVRTVAQVTEPPGGAGVTPSTPNTYTAADFPEKVTVKRVYTLAAMIYSSAHPKAREDGTVTSPIWPPALAEGRLPVIFAYMVVGAELGGGVLVLLGLFTRLAAFSLAGVMAGAAWLTQIGPAIQNGDTVLGFLPSYARWDVGAWTPLMWQGALIAMSLALMFSGPGYMAVDHALFGGRRGREDHDGE